MHVITLPDGRRSTTTFFVGGDWTEGMNCDHCWHDTNAPFQGEDGGVWQMQACRHCTGYRCVEVVPGQVTS